MRITLRSLLPAVAMLAAVGMMAAQAPPPAGGRRGPGRGPGMMLGIPGVPGLGGIGGFGGFLSGRGGPVTDAPFSATAEISVTRGTASPRQITVQLARDAAGRTYAQTTAPGRGGANGANAAADTVTRIVDPVAHLSYTVSESRKEVVERPLPPPPAGNPPPPGPPANRPARPGVTTSDLGTQTINGVEANGRRVTRTVGARGNQPAGEIVTETWVAPSLKLTVKATRTGPGNDSLSYTLGSLTTSAPEASLFVPPAGYTVRRAPGRGRRGPGRGPGGAAGPGGAPVI